METLPVAGFEKYGLSGLVIAALFGLILFIVKEHRTERAEWIAQLKEFSEVLRVISSKRCDK